jgi:hypothetical protein
MVDKKQSHVDIILNLGVFQCVAMNMITMDLFELLWLISISFIIYIYILLPIENIVTL